MSTSAHQKAELRTHYRAIREKLTHAQVQHASAAVCKNLEKLNLPAIVKHVGAYHSFRNEIDIDAVLGVLRAQGCHIYLPRIAGPGALDFVAVNDSTQMVAGTFGITEPEGPPRPSEQIELFLVPAVAFDQNGQRLGFGKGFYDRVLHSKGSRRPIAIGIAYEWQLTATPLPVEEHDIAMDIIVTDAGSIFCSPRVAYLEE